MRLLAAALAAFLATSALAADPAPAAPAKASKSRKKPASAEGAALKDAKQALLGPCSPDQASGKVVAVEVIDGEKMNAAVEAEKLPLQKAVPAARFLKVKYEEGGKEATDYRQVTTSHGLTTEQAQALVGEKLCVFGRAP